MMKPLPNSRQIPTKKEITSQKTYYDKLYGYLQAISEKDIISEKRFFKKPSFIQLAENLDLDKNTVSSRFKKLIELGLIIQSTTEKKIFFLKEFPIDEAYLIPKATIEFLAITQKHHTITVYVYLLRRYIANKEQPFTFTINSLKEICGDSTSSRNNNHKYDLILSVLRDIGLAECELKTETDGDIIKKHWYCKKVSQNYIPSNRHI